MKQKTILLVDDEPSILDFLSYNLKKSGYKVIQASNAFDAIEITKQKNPDLIIMDLMMPKMDGIEASQNIRELNLSIQPIITILSSRSEDYSQIAAFSAGVNDYITKPIRPRLLISKIASLFRRELNPINKENKNNLIIKQENYSIELEGNTIQFSKKEFELLTFLSNSPGKVFNRETILLKIWGSETSVGERTIDVHIRKLREKLGNDYIRTIKGIGYTFREL